MTGVGTLYDRLLQDLENSAKVKQEVISGRRIGFYRLKSQLGSGNFAQVKLGLHLLTNGEYRVVIAVTHLCYSRSLPSS
jgi:serine/threonine-protein kinase NIM1